VKNIGQDVTFPDEIIVFMKIHFGFIIKNHWVDA